MVGNVAPERFDGVGVRDDSLEAQWEAEHDQMLVRRLLELVRHEFTETTWRAFQLLTVGNVAPDEVASRLGISINAAVIAKSRVFRRLRILGKDLVDTF
jgi:DNA-directed RNA polymerase specialized sigma24 family protein